MRGLDEDQIEFYRRLDPEQAVCRGKRRHDFPGIIPGREIPASIRIAAVGRGVAEITEHCERGCGRFITYLTDSHGVPDYSTRRYGGGGERYHATGLGLTAANDQSFMAFSQAETINNAVALAAKKAS